MPIGSSAWTASFAFCCRATAPASARSPGEICLESRPPTTGKKPVSERSAACGPSFTRWRIKAFPPSGLGAFFGMPMPTSTGMYDRAFGPRGTGNATRSSGRWSSAVFNRAT